MTAGHALTTRAQRERRYRDKTIFVVVTGWTHVDYFYKMQKCRQRCTRLISASRRGRRRRRHAAPPPGAALLVIDHRHRAIIDRSGQAAAGLRRLPARLVRLLAHHAATRRLRLRFSPPHDDAHIRQTRRH